MTMTKYEPKATLGMRGDFISYSQCGAEMLRKEIAPRILADLTHAETAIKEAYAEIEVLREMLRLENIDSCSTDATIRAEAKKVLSATLVDGDTHGVPDVTEIVCMLVKEIERLRAESSCTQCH